MRPIRKGYVDIAEGQIHFHAAEGDAPAIVFLHQTALSAKTYDPLLRVLCVPNRLIALDTPGFGGSFNPSGWPDLETYADQLLRALDPLGERRIHLFGHHTGASLAIEMAARAPDRIASLMLAGPVFMTPQEQADFIAGYSEPIQPQRDGGHLLANWRYSADHNADCDLAIMQDAVVDMLRAWRARPQAYMAVAHHDTEARARSFDLPTLLLTSPGDYFHDAFPRAEAIFPHAATAVTGGDNFPAASDPQGVAAAIASFLGGV